MNISEIRRLFAQRQQDILKVIFDGLENDKFDISQIDLSKFTVADLSDFWLVSTGFLGVQAFDNYEFSDKEATDILSGLFYLKDVTNSEAQRLYESFGNDEKLRFDMDFDRVLCEVQDGVYTLENESRYRFNSAYIRLNTEPIEFNSNLPIPAENVQIIKFVRNIIAHDMPFIQGLKLKFYGGNYEITTSKMWLRGLMENFVFSSIMIDSEKLFDILTERTKDYKSALASNHDVDKTLSLIVDVFDKDVQSKFFRMNNFIKARVALIPDFFEKDLAEQLKIISVLISKNPNYIQSSNETINPSIIYNIIQIIAQEIERRNEHSILEMQDIKVEEIDKDIKNHEMALSESLKWTRSREHQQNRTKLRELQKKLLEHERRLKNIQKHETTGMKLLNIQELENLPIEAAFNLVCIMGFNALNTSEFFEDLIENMNARALNQQQIAFFKNFNLSQFTITPHGSNKPFVVKNSGDVVIVLNGIRNALSHGNATYHLPNLKKYEKFNLKDLKMTLNSRAYKIEGKLIDFYTLFNLPAFFGPRGKEIYIGKPENLAEIPEYDLEVDESQNGSTKASSDPKKFE